MELPSQSSLYPLKHLAGLFSFPWTKSQVAMMVLYSCFLHLKRDGITVVGILEPALVLSEFEQFPVLVSKRLCSLHRNHLLLF